ncbi:leucine-rich repeat protein [Oscillospiraceae bacterium LCP21S3_E10]
MATYEFNNKIKFMLPAGYLFSRDEDDEGNEIVNITAGEYENDEGETCYKFTCRVSYTEYDPEEADEEFTSDNLLDLLAERMEDSRRMKLPGTPKTILINKGMPLSIFGRVMKMFASIGLIQVSDWSVLQLITTGLFNDDDPQANSERYEYLYEVLKATRINGKKLPIDSTSPSQIEEALQLTFDEDGEAIDVSPKIQFNFTNGDETTTYEYTTDGMKEVGKEKLRSVDPDEKLYPHYASIKNNVFNFFPGAIVNGSGTEFEFQKFGEMLNTWSSDPEYEERKPLLQKINDLNPAGYTLADTAKDMIKLFRVDKDVFVEGHDRESELIHGYMRRAYMMSAIRSFAWTLADYCKEHESTPEDIDNSIPSRIANFVASRDWLNYDGKTYCKGLCSGSDLHVYFLPDATSKADKSKFLPSQEDKDRVKEMKAKLPSYNEILCEVHSLEALRKDLEYIYPAVKVLYDSLAEDRDTSETLEGNESDIVYAWIALAMAAEGPFFTEDGPMNYGFGWPGEEEEWQANWEAEEAARVEEEAEQWMRKYEKYLEDDPVINFNGSIFVFSGLAGHWAEKEHPTVQKVIEKGGQYRSKVSGLTNYLVVNPGYAGQSKIVAVMEQLQKGKNIKVILLEDLEKALEGKASSKKTASTTSTKTTATKTASSKTTSTKSTTKTSSATSSSVSQKVTGTKVSKNDCDIDYLDTLTAYNGSAKAIVLPDGISAIGEDAFLSNDDITSVVIPEGVETIEDGAFWMCHNLKTVVLPSTIRKIGDNAFNSCEQLTSIVIPDGCEEIGADAFTSCKKLKDIYVPGSVYEIGDDAFYTFNDAMVIHTSRGSEAERFAKEHDWKVDYKSAPSSSASTSSAKKATSPAKAKAESDTESLAGAMGDLSAQIAEMESQELSAEDQEKLQEIKGLMNDLGDQLAEGQAGLSKYGDYLEQKEAREKAQEEEKARKKAEAMAAGKSEKDIVNMYIILTNEKKLGQLHRAQDKFFEIYEEDFAALSKSEVIQTRKDMLAEMEDDSLCSYYAESFKQRSVEDRFSVSTRNLNNVSENPELGEKAEWAIENSKEWYTPAEYAEVRRLMDADLADTRKQLDDQLKPIDDGWTKYSTGKDSLQIVITNKATDGSDMQPNFSNFQVAIGSQLVSVQIATGGMFRMSTTVMNCFTWYWGVTVRDIWEAARKNELRDEREGAYNGAQLADQALNQIRTKHPATKVTSSTSSYSKPASSPSYTATSTSSNTSSNSTQRSNTSTTSSQQTQPAKKEGCYIATAVYGSYDAPEVITLRRFRDETLRNSAFGRWFIRTYYRLSPPVAEKLKNAKRINAFVRSILDKWVERLNRKQR